MSHGVMSSARVSGHPMRVCMVLHDPQAFGGLEEIAATVAIGLREQGIDVSVLSDKWTPPDNQYVRRVREHGVTWVQMPRWLSYPASDWDTKERLLRALMSVCTPVVWGLSVPVWMARRGDWRTANASAHNWLRGVLTRWLVAPDRTEPLTRCLLSYWRWRWRPDVLHVQGYTNSLLFVVEWAHQRHVPVVYQEHQTPTAEFDWWSRFPSVINKADVVVAVSEESARALKSICKVTKPVEVRHPPLPDPYAVGWRESARGGPGTGPLRLTTVARLWVTKGLNYLLESAVDVTRRYPGTEFRVHGGGQLRDELMARAAELGLDGGAIFVGPFTSRDELGRIMAETDIFVMPSTLEGQPVGLVEAMAYGRPIVATRVGGIPEIIQDGVNGLLCAPAQPDELTERICRLIADPALRTQLGRAARASYERSPFQPTAVCTAFADLYRTVLDRQQLGPAAQTT